MVELLQNFYEVTGLGELRAAIWFFVDLVIVDQFFPGVAGNPLFAALDDFRDAVLAPWR